MRSPMTWMTVLCLAACGGRPADGHADSPAPSGGPGGRSHSGPHDDPGKVRSTVHVIDVEIEAGTNESSLELEFRTLEVPPPLMQLDVVTDPSRIRFRPDVTGMAATPTVRAGIIAPGRIRILLGDALSPAAATPVPNGSLASIPFELLPGPPASIPVWVESVVVSDPTGEFEGGPQVFPGPAATISAF